MGQLIPFESASLPAHLQGFSAGISGDDLTAGATGGYPVISIKGKVFTIVRGEERNIIPDPQSDEDMPARYIDVVMLRANPGLSKNYYEGEYVEGSQEKPTCYSLDGVAPAADAQEPQSTKCATCPHNQWGSRITEDGKKAKVCSDMRRLAVAASGQINDPMLIRVPAASLKTLAQYGELLKKRGVSYPAVVTRISFDFSVAHPALTFKPVEFIDAETAKMVQEEIGSDLVAQIVGLQPSPAAVAAAIERDHDVAPAPEPVKAEKPAAAPKPAKSGANPFAVQASAEKAADKPEVKVSSPAPAATKTQKKSAAIVVEDADLEAALGGVLDKLDKNLESDD